MLDSKGETQDACRQFGKFRENCPEVAEAYQREGVCQAKLGAVDEAKKSLEQCAAKATDEALKDDCQRLREKL
jgi:TolA-binding protein